MPYVLGPTVSVGTFPVGLTFGSGSLWVGDPNLDSIFRIDPVALSVTATITGVSDPTAIHYAFGSVWARSGNNIKRVDPATNTVTATIAMGSAPEDITSDSTDVWVANRTGSTTKRIDPTTDTVTATLTSSLPRAVAVGFGSIWIASGVNTIDRWDASTLAFTTSTTMASGELANDLRCVFGSVWATTSRFSTPRLSVIEVDPASNAIVSRLRSSGDQGGTEITDDGSGIWYTQGNPEAIRRVDPTTVLITDDLRVFATPQGCTVDDDNKVWFAHGTVVQRVDFLPDPVGWVRGHAWG
jgi:glutamine cyclotransferase